MKNWRRKRNAAKERTELYISMEKYFRSIRTSRWDPDSTHAAFPCDNNNKTQQPEPKNIDDAPFRNETDPPGAPSGKDKPENDTIC